MSHHIYHTRGFILSSTQSGESNRSYKIFTEELGLVFAVAQSVREGKSKLKYTLQDFSFVTVDLVRGKEVWRIVSAGVYQPLDTIKQDATRLKMFARFLAFLERLVQGEWRDQDLFDETIRVAEFLERCEIKREVVLPFETLVALRVLVHLGYMDRAGYESFLEEGAYSQDTLYELEKVRLDVLPKINEALSATHL